jgi:hypothetical protein
MVWFVKVRGYTITNMTLERLSDDNLFNTPTRFRQINALRETFSLDPLEMPTTPSNPNTPTAGLEIEMTWRQAFKDMHDPWLHSDISPKYDLDIDSAEYRAFHMDYMRNSARLLPILHSLTPVIPRVGNDAFWEFSFDPVKDPSVAHAELKTLYDADILFEDIPYPTHMTIAGISSNRDAASILCLLEQAGGTTSKRLEAPLHSKIHPRHGAWMQKGNGGLRKRYEHELVGDDMTAYEFRTLVTTSPEQMNRIFRLGQELAHTCLHHPLEWKKTRDKVEASLVAHGLPLRMWGPPTHEPLVWDSYRENLISK